MDLPTCIVDEDTQKEYAAFPSLVPFH